MAYIPIDIPELNLSKIKYLYISHNKICTFSGIDKYPNLVSLNVSYNELVNI